MIKKLRIKLIAVSMVSLFTVLFIIAGTINLMNYIGVVRDADSICLLYTSPSPRD